jgi:hypothetical protein
MFQIASQAAEEEPGARKQRGVYDDVAIAKELVLLNEERARHGQDPTSPEWLSSLGASSLPLLSLSMWQPYLVTTTPHSHSCLVFSIFPLSQ